MDKLMMNKLDDMELDMVAGGRGGSYEPLRRDTNTLNELYKYTKKGVKAVVNGVENAVDNLLSKVFGPPRRR